MECNDLYCILNIHHNNFSIVGVQWHKLYNSEGHEQMLCNLNMLHHPGTDL